jgi:serralysin
VSRANGFAGASYVVFGQAPTEDVTRTGTAIANRIHGGAGNDTITGGAGNDRMTGGAGADTLTGGGGADNFTYTGAGQSTSTTHDTIVDFDATSR